jgi:hypothetical protein
MEITCSHCDTKLNVPDDKIPGDQTVWFNCPKCKGKITIDPQGAMLNEQSPDNPQDKGKTQLEMNGSKQVKGTAKEGLFDNEGSNSDDTLEYFGENTKLALVMADDDIGERVRVHLEGLGYRYVLSPNTRDALGKLRFHHFDLILVSEGFDGADIENNPIMNYLNHMSMSSRRRIFLILMGDDLKTMDDMKSYALSANMTINTRDLDNLPLALIRGLAEHEKLYKVFMDTLVEAGKA